MMIHPVDPDFILASLLNEGRRVVRKGGASEARERLREQEAKAAARHAEREAAKMALLQWNPVSHIAHMDVAQCTACGERHTIFNQFATLMTRRVDDATRILSQSRKPPDDGLPREVRYTQRQVAACALCFTADTFATELPYAKT